MPWLINYKHTNIQTYKHRNIQTYKHTIETYKHTSILVLVNLFFVLEFDKHTKTSVLVTLNSSQ